MEDVEVTIVWINILTPGALFSGQATSIPKLSFDTVFFLSAYKYVLQAVSVIFPMKAVMKNGRWDDMRDNATMQLEWNGME